MLFQHIHHGSRSVQTKPMLSLKGPTKSKEIVFVNNVLDGKESLQWTDYVFQISNVYLSN